MGRQHTRALRGSVTISPAVVFAILLLFGGILAKDIFTIARYRFGETVSLTELQPGDLTQNSVAVGTVNAVCMEVSTVEHQTIEHDGTQKHSYKEAFYLCCCGDSYLLVSAAHREILPCLEEMQAAADRQYGGGLLPADMLHNLPDTPDTYIEGRAKKIPSDIRKTMERLIKLRFDDPDAVLAAMPDYYLQSGQYQTTQYLTFTGCGLAVVGLSGLLGTLLVHLRKKRAANITG